MKRRVHSRTIALGFGMAVALLSWIGMASYWSTHQLVRSFGDVTEAHQALEMLQGIGLMMESAESSVRGYVITGDEKRLEAFHRARMLVPSKLKEVGRLVVPHTSMAKKLKRLDQLLRTHLTYLGGIVVLRQTQGYEPAASWISTEDEYSQRDAMESLLGELQTQEQTQVRQRWHFASDHSLRTKTVLVAASAVSFLLLLWLYGLLRRESTERHLAQSATQRMETFLHSIIERIPYMILVKETENLRLTLANKAAEEWLGRSKDDLLGSNEFDLRPHDEAMAAIQKDREALSAGGVIETPDEAFKVAGREPRTLRTQKVAVPDDEGRPAFLLQISEDITQRKQAERMLELSRDAAVESARLKAEFIRNMSHEFRTPLAIVVGMTSLLLDTELSSDQRRFASTVQRAAQGLSQLSKDILDFSKIETGAFALESDEVRVREITESVITMLGPQAKTKGVNLVPLVHQEVPAAMRGDPSRLRQVLTQLIGNAVKFTERGEVIVRVEEARRTDSQQWLEWRIQDTGIGIDDEMQKHLFEPFRQGDGSRTRKFGGTGLGLAMSKRIVELMGGEIGFESKAGAGSTFWFRIPFPSAANDKKSSGTPTLPWTQSRVLVISENETLRKMLQEQLHTWALASEGASSGQSAIDLLKREQQAGRPFPIVLMDMHLPDMEGAAFARAVQKEEALHGIKLLVMTGGDFALDADTSAALGFSGSVSNPPKPEELYQRLTLIIEPKKARSAA